MNAFWAYFLPTFAIGLVAGVVGSTIAYYRIESRRAWRAGAIALALVATALWHGPFGAADRFSTEVESIARMSLESWEMPQITARLHRAPLSRRIFLSGKADDFQRSELAKIIETIPGVSRAQWTDRAGVPLVVEGLGVTVLGFLFGMLFAYLGELHRRYNAQWNW